MFDDMAEISNDIQNLAKDNHAIDVDSPDEAIDNTIFLSHVATDDALEETVEDVLETQKSFDKASMAMGGRIRQQILTDDNTVDYYHEKHDGLAVVYMVFKNQFRSIMSRGKRQNEKKDKFVHSGEVGGVQVPLKK